MPIYQAYNKRIGAWVKYEFSKKGWEALDVKQRKPNIPFKGIIIRFREKK